jgi:MFS family permease
MEERDGPPLISGRPGTPAETRHGTATGRASVKLQATYQLVSTGDRVVKQIRTLFLINLILYFTGSSLFPLLPLLAASYGATPALIGLHLALLAGSNAAGMAVAGRLASRIALKYLFMVSAFLGAAMLFWLAAVSVLWVVMAATTILWFLGGAIYSQATLLAGLIADEDSRGRSFGIMVLASPLGAVLGGLAVGALIARLSFGAAFLVMAVLWLAIPLLVHLALIEKAIETVQASPSSRRRKAPLGSAFPLLLLTAALASAAASVGQISINLTMQMLSFTPQAISSTTVISGFAAIPVTFLVGGLSDRVGRGRILLFNFLLIALVVGGMTRATLLWQFWLGAAPLLVGSLVSHSVLSALATDLLPRTSLERGLPFLMAVMTVTGIPGSIGAGYLIQTFGPVTAFSTAAILALAALAALLALSATSRPIAGRSLLVSRRLARRAA